MTDSKIQVGAYYTNRAFTDIVRVVKHTEGTVHYSLAPGGAQFSADVTTFSTEHLALPTPGEVWYHSQRNEPVRVDAVGHDPIIGLGIKVKWQEGKTSTYSYQDFVQRFDKNKRPEYREGPAVTLSVEVPPEVNPETIAVEVSERLTTMGRDGGVRITEVAQYATGETKFVETTRPVCNHGSDPRDARIEAMKKALDEYKSKEADFYKTRDKVNEHYTAMYRIREAAKKVSHALADLHQATIHETRDALGDYASTLESRRRDLLDVAFDTLDLED